MPIKVDHRGLRGDAPDADPIYAKVLADAWHKKALEHDVPFAVPGTLFRASWAGTCTRALLYNIAGVEYSNPPNVADLWRMNIGTMVHEAIQEVFPQAFPGADCEVKADLRPDMDGSCTIDIVIRYPDVKAKRATKTRPAEPARKGKVVSIEIKTVNGFGFKMMATPFKGEPEGPKQNHRAQGALGAKSVDADELVIIYLSLECVSVQEAARHELDVYERFLGQWTYSREEYLPWVEDEAKRLAWLTGRVEKLAAEITPPVGAKDYEPPKHKAAFEVVGETPTLAAQVPRLIRIDDGSLVTVTDPGNKGAWVQRSQGEVLGVGNTWHCDYCWHRDTCISHGQ